MRRGERSEHGFTAIEVLIAVAAVALLSSIVLSLYLQASAYAARLETERRVGALREAFESFYRDNTQQIESAPPALLASEPSSAIASGADLGAEALRPLQAYLRQAGGDASRDGYGRSIRLYVSAPMTQSVEGLVLTYRRLALVSAGRNGRFESVDWNPDLGRLTVAGDDVVAFVDGVVVQRDQVRETRRRVVRLLEAIRGYAASRFYANPARDPTIDYFGAGPADSGWDDGNGLLRGADRPARAAQRIGDAELTALGLSRADAVDAWGGDIGFDNDSQLVRQPGNAASGMNTPPYSARLIVQLPGGGSYAETLIGSF
jgi:prepilin-type N-terminal cleavage/methylation domain-containing protein